MPIVTPEEPSEDTSFNIETVPNNENTYQQHLPSSVTDYIELDAFREIPYSINYRRLPPEHQPESNNKLQALVGLLTGFMWLGMVAVEHKQRGKRRHRYYFSKGHVRIVKRRRGKR